MQLGDKANFIFSHQCNWSWLVGIQLCGNIIQLVVFTWGGNAHTVALDIYKNKKQLMNILSYLSDAPAHDLGIDDELWGTLGAIHWEGDQNSFKLIGLLFISQGTAHHPYLN